MTPLPVWQRDKPRGSCVGSSGERGGSTWASEAVAAFVDAIDAVSCASTV